MPRSQSPRRTILLTLTLLATTLGAITLQGGAAGATTTQTLRLSARGNMVLRFNTGQLHAHPGRINIVMHNPSNAGMSHGIALEGHGVDKDGPIVDAGHNSVLTVVLSKKGRYTFYCPVPGHKEAGMKGTLTVS